MKRLYIIVFLGIYICSMVQAQIGINTTDPDESTALHIVGKGQVGLLIPFMSFAQRGEILNPANGLLVYDANEKMFYFYNNSQWIALNPLQAADGTTNTVKLSDNTPTLTIDNAVTINDALTVTGTLTANNTVQINSTLTTTGDISTSGLNAGTGTIASETANVTTVNATTVNATTVNATNGYGITPLGGIIMWSGKIIPEGWALCDGNTVEGYLTPDLRGRFVLGYGTEGSAIPSVWDNHYSQPGNLSEKGTAKGNTGGEMKHQLTIPEMPRHRHSFKFKEEEWGDDANHRPFPNAGGTTIHHTEFEGGDQPHENRPPYYVLAFIMRVR